MREPLIGGTFWLYLFAVAVVLAVTGFLADQLYLASIGGNGAERAYGGLAALFGLAAVSAALLAVVFTFPTFVVWARAQFQHPDIQLSFQIALDHDGVPVPAKDHHEVPSRVFILRACAYNPGDAPLQDAIVNISAPLGCVLSVIDDPKKQHYGAVLPLRNVDRRPGDPEYWRYTVGYENFIPKTEYLFHVEVAIPGLGTCRMMAGYDGDPSPRNANRFLRIDVTVVE